MDVNATPLRNPLQVITLLLLFSLFSLTAKAFPMVWNLDGVTFNDGGTASGSFTYDADTNMYSDIAISTTSGISRIAASYDVLNLAYAGSNAYQFTVCYSQL